MCLLPENQLSCFLCKVIVWLVYALYRIKKTSYLGWLGWFSGKRHMINDGNSFLILCFNLTYQDIIVFLLR